MRCERLHDSAVYVLGALSPIEREAYERHLADCAECRAEVADFSDLPGLLGRLDPEIAASLIAGLDSPSAMDLDPSSAAGLDRSSAADLDPSSAAGLDPRGAAPSRWAGPTFSDRDEAASAAPARWAGPTVAPAGKVNGARADPLLPRVLDRARSVRRTERRRRQWRTAGTALVAAFLGVIAVIGVRAAGIGQPDYEAMREVAATVPVTAQLAVSSDDEGTVVRMKCAYKPGEGDEYTKWTYKLVVVPKTGDAEEIDTWSARSGDELQLTAHSSIARADVARIEIRKGDGTPLLSLAT